MQDKTIPRNILRVLAYGLLFVAISIALSFLFFALSLLAYGIGWALIYGDGPIPLWYSIFMAVLTFTATYLSMPLGLAVTVLIYLRRRKKRASYH
jgi:hypothetical protein